MPARRDLPPSQGWSAAAQRATPVEQLAERARADLAGRLQCAVADITISGIRALKPVTTCPAADLSCQPGSPVCGYAVALFHDGRRYDYLVQDAELSPCPPIVPG